MAILQQLAAKLSCRRGNCRSGQWNGHLPGTGQPRGKGMTQAIIRFTWTGEHCRWRFFFPPLSICIFARDCGAHPVLFAQQERPPVRATGNFCGMWVHGAAPDYPSAQPRFFPLAQEPPVNVVLDRSLGRILDRFGYRSRHRSGPQA